MKKWICLIALLSVLWGCSSDDVITNPPAPLPSFSEEVSLRQIWSTKVGDGLGEKFIRIKPAVLDDSVFAASADGVVAAYDRMTGAKRWEINVGSGISGGVGAGEGKVFVGTLNGELIALDTQNGSVAWHVPVTSEILSVPQIGGGLVVTQGNDDMVMAFSVSDGSQQWSYNDLPPALTVRGTASPLVTGSEVIVGLASGRVVVLGAALGEVIWDRAVSAGEGRTELDRLRDVDGSPSLNQGTLFVGNYQGHVAALDAYSGEIKWENDVSTLLATVTNNDNVYVTDADSNVIAYDQTSGSPTWSVKELNYRSLTGPELFENYVVVADFEGYVHLMAASDGRFVGRDRTNEGVRVQPLVANGTLYIYDNGGNLTAFELVK